MTPWFPLDKQMLQVIRACEDVEIWCIKKRQNSFGKISIYLRIQKHTIAKTLA